MQILTDTPKRPRPCLVIVCALEESPVVRLEAFSAEDEERLRLWVDGVPELRALVDEALQGRRAA
jgi:hypothetical protein